ncbi:MAG TPA: metal ABC transporter permease [Candidatus Cloacimonadota bacterium]|nr:metal ABC transporter permease [Candidatus Cloacimonadota bacterium]HPT71390.1 metal ABC transporter permease [Candidatus Cloacimonadota bacterium]
MQVFSIFQVGFLAKAFLGAILASLATAILSPFISLKRISYMGEALSHVSFAGIALALFVGWHMDLTAICFVVAVAVIIGYISRHYNLEETNITTVFLSVSMALGILLISLKKDYTIDLSSYLFGNVLLITQADIIHMGILLIVNVLFIVLLFKELFYMTYNQSIARVFRIPVDVVYYAFLILIALNIVVAVKVIGVILITAELVLPGMIAFNLTKNLRKAILMSFSYSILSALVGFGASYWLDIPTGSSIVLTLFALFLLSLVAKLRKV